MTPEIRIDIEVTDDERERIAETVEKAAQIDYQGRVTGEDGSPRQVVRVHVTRDPMPGAEDARPRTLRANEPGVHLIIEDDAGRFVPLEKCEPFVKSEHVLGAIIRSGDNFWVFSFAHGHEDEAIIRTAEEIEAGTLKPVLVHGQSDFCIKNSGPLSEIGDGESMEGEYEYTVEEKPVLDAVPWWSELLPEPGSKAAESEYSKVRARLFDVMTESVKRIEAENDLPSPA